MSEIFFFFLFVCLFSDNALNYLKHCTCEPEKRDLRTYANSEDPDQPAHLRSLVRIFAIRLHNIGILLKL